MMMDKKKMMGVTFNGSVTFNGPMFDIHDNKSVTIVNDRQHQEAPLTASEKDIKKAIEELLKEKDSQGEFVLKNKKQWWAVYRVLREFCNYPTKMTAFVAKMNDLRLDYAENGTTITYDSLSATTKDVPLMNCSTSTWDSLKDKSDNYMQQYVVANFLMLKLGIKT